MILRESSRSLWSVATYAGVFVLLFLVVRFGADAGAVWDEPIQAEYGERVLNWFSSRFADHGAMTYENLYLYGGLFEAAAQWIVKRSPYALYETRHLLTAIAGLVGVIFTVLAAQRVAGGRAGFVAGLVIATTPAWVGHSLFNSKDIPFGAATIAAMYGSVRLATGSVPSRLVDMAGVGVAIGLALAVRPAGYFLFAFPAIAVAAAAIARWTPSLAEGPRNRGLDFWMNPLRLLITVPIAWLLMLVAWPWAQVAPITRPLHAMEVASNFPWGGETLFSGAMVKSTALPWTYLPTWFAITTPETYLVGVALGFFAITIGRRALDVRRTAGTMTVAVGTLLPLGAAVYFRPELYDGLRHFVFVFPLVAVLVGISVSAFLSSSCTPLFRLCGVAAFAFAGWATLTDLVRLHPYEYVYFNRLFGGLQAAQGRYETDYWGASYKEGLAWVVNEFPGVDPGRPTRVSSCNPNSNARLNYYRTLWPGADRRVEIVTEYRVSEIYLAVTRYDCHRRPGEIIHAVARQGVPLLYVIRTIPNY